MLKALLISGDEDAVSVVTKILAEFDPRLILAKICSNVKEGVLAINQDQPDILILDTKLPDGTGFELLKHVDPASFKIVFLSNHIEFALKAFKFNAIDFILKPADPEEFSLALNKALEIIGREEKMHFEIMAENIRNLNKKEKLILKTFDHIHLVNLEEIIRVEADKNYSTFYILDGRKIMVSKSIKDFEDHLNNKGFYRIHKSHIINISLVKYFDKSEGGFLVMCDGMSIPVASRKRELLLELFNSLA